jgi:DNA-binding XRE family transcriptional regulator
MIRMMPAKDRTLSAFGRNVARLRADKGFSQEKLAEKADLDRTYVSGIERGGSNSGIKLMQYRNAKVGEVVKSGIVIGRRTTWVC